MFKKKLFTSLLVLVLTVFLAVGCGSTQSASTILQNGFDKTIEASSYAFDGSFQLNLDLPEEVLYSFGPDEMFAFEMLKNSKINYRGTYQVDPLQYEFIVSADLNLGDIKTNISVPVVLNEQKMWIKIPNIPGVDELEAIAGKFIELDFEELAELSGEEMPDFSTIKEQNKLSQQLSAIFFKHLGDNFVQKMNIKDLNLPKELNGKDAVKFTITKENLPELIKLFAEKIGPEMLDLLSKPENVKLLQIDPDDIREVRQGLKEIEPNLDEFLEELNKYVTISKAEMINVTNKDGFITKQVGDFSFNVTPPEEEGTLTVGLKMEMNMTNINGTQTFENTFPPAGDILNFEELMGMMMGFDDGFAYDEEDYYFGEDDELEDGADELLHDLIFQLSQEPWFIENEEIMNALDNNEELMLAILDPDTLVQLMENVDYRKEFFATYGIELP